MDRLNCSATAKNITGNRTQNILIKAMYDDVHCVHDNNECYYLFNHDLEDFQIKSSRVLIQKQLQHKRSKV